ncbi:MAG: DUF3899 domain-containing protein [Oscillospiraceae bacterium]|nr:DUF3899 domain-containing protein [Oscillospiraceae bacterium]
MVKKRILKYAAVLLICAVMTFAYVSSQGLASKKTAEKYRILADGFTIPGLLVTGFGVMMIISDTGSLDGVIFGMQQAFRMLTFQFLSKDKPLNYGEFKDRREEMRRLRRLRGGGFGYIVITGGAFLAAALVFTGLYLRETGGI